MLLLRRFLPIFFVVCFGNAQADGNKLLSECEVAERAWEKSETADEFAVAHCVGLIQGINETLTLFESELKPSMNICWPRRGKDVVGIRTRQALRVVLAYLREHPADLHKDEVVLVILAFKAAYPCKNAS